MRIAGMKGRPLRRSPLALLIAVSLSGTVCTASAQTEADPPERNEFLEGSLAELLNTEIRVVSKRDESLKRTPAEVTVYTREDLDRLKPRNLSDLLELTTGFLVGRDTDDISWGSRGVVTDNNQKYLIAIDGHRINNNNNFGPNPFHKTRNLINIADRIEIIRGPGGVFWGPDAFLGLINIVTRRASKNPGGSSDLSVTYGFDDSTKAASASLLETIKVNDKEVKTSVFLDMLRSSGEEIDTSLSGQGGADITPGSYLERFKNPTASLNVRLETDSTWVSGQVTNAVSSVEGSRQEEEFSQLYLEVGKEFTLAPEHTASLRLYGDRFEAERRSSDDATPALFSVTPETRLGGEVTMRSTWSRYISSMVGVDSRYYRYTGGIVGVLDPDSIGTSVGTVTPDPRFPIYSSAVGDYYWNGVFGELVGEYGRWDVRLGGRYDTFSDKVDDLFAPRASVGFYPLKDVAIKLLYAEGALRPAWSQLTGFFSFQGQRNENLRSEESRSFELLVDVAGSNYLSSFSLYHSSYDDTINFVTTRTGSGYVNYANYRTTGIEWENRVTYGGFLDAFLNLTHYFDVQRDEELEVLAGSDPVFGSRGIQVRPGTDEPYNIPNLFFATGVTAKIPIFQRELEITPIVRYTGKRWVQPRDNLPERKIDSLYLDLKAGIKVTQSLDASLIARNILDNDDSEGIGRGIAGLVIPKGSTWEVRLTQRF